MVNEIPTISITQDYNIDDDEAEENEGGDIAEAHTDIEDLDTDGDDRCKFQTLKTRKKVKSKRIDDCHTDIEDCADSGSDDQMDWQRTNEDDKLSLNEFLDQGNVEETASCGGDRKTKNTKRGKRASLIPPQDEAGGVTDCEDYDTDDEDIGIVIVEDNQEYEEFLLHNDDFRSEDVEKTAFVRNNNDHKRWRASTSKNVEVSSDSESDRPANWGELSDVENIQISDQEDGQRFFSKMKHSKSALDVEEVDMAVSDVEDIDMVGIQRETQPEIDIAFSSVRSKRSSKHNRKPKANTSKNALAVQENPDEAITDVENLNSSDDEGPNVRKNLSIPIAYVKSGDKALTDTEDFDLDDDCLPSCSTDIKLPSPVREIVMLREDKQGDPVAKVMPLVASNALLGVEEYLEKGLTDTEDMSGNEDEFDNTYKYEIIELPDLDSGNVNESENITTLKRDRCGISEPLTDVEELRMGGGKQLRRKKSKPKSSKPKPFLGVNRNDDEEGVTDNELLYVSDDQIDQFRTPRNRLQLSAREANQDNAVTDTEDISGDEEDYKRPNTSEIDSNIFQQEAFFSTITLSDGASKKAQNNREQGYSKISTVLKTREEADSSNDLGATDVEEMIQSDNEEFLSAENSHSRANSTTPNELRNVFNEYASSCVHDLSKNEYDLRNEAQHIKQYGDIQDNHTDNEYLSDGKSIVSFCFVIFSDFYFRSIYTNFFSTIFLLCFIFSLKVLLRIFVRARRTVKRFLRNYQNPHQLTTSFL